MSNANPENQFTPGNQFWKQRSKHGRDKLFKTPTLLWDAACEYFEWCDEHPLMAAEQARGGQKAITSRDGDTILSNPVIEIPRMRAYTLIGFLLYVHADESFWRKFKDNCLKNNLSDFFTVIKEVEMIIYNQKFTGAAAGFLNPNIIARDLGLTEKTEVEQRTTMNNGEFVINVIKGGK